MRSCWISVTTALAWQAHSGHVPAARPALYEYVLVGGAVVVLVWVFYLAIRVSVWPGEEEPDHIKRLILEDREKGSHE